jgi:hypothetical protein
MSPMQSGNTTHQRDICGAADVQATPSDTPTVRRKNKRLGVQGKVIGKVRSEQREQSGRRGAAEGQQCRTWSMK